MADERYLGIGGTEQEALTDAEAKAKAALGVNTLTNIVEYAFAGSLLDQNGDPLKDVTYIGVVRLSR